MNSAKKKKKTRSWERRLLSHRYYQQAKQWMMEINGSDCQNHGENTWDKTRNWGFVSVIKQNWDSHPGCQANSQKKMSSMAYGWNPMLNQQVVPKKNWSTTRSWCWAIFGQIPSSNSWNINQSSPIHHWHPAPCHFAQGTASCGYPWKTWAIPKWFLVVNKPSFLGVYLWVRWIPKTVSSLRSHSWRNFDAADTQSKTTTWMGLFVFPASSFCMLSLWNHQQTFRKSCIHIIPQITIKRKGNMLVRESLIGGFNPSEIY